FEKRNTLHKIVLDKKITQISTTSRHTLLLTGIFIIFLFPFLEDHQVYSCGYNKFGQLGLNHNFNQNVFQWIDIFKGKKMIQIDCGSAHSCALTGNQISKYSKPIKKKMESFILGDPMNMDN